MVDRVWPVDAVSGAPAYSGRAARQASLAPLLAGATAARPLGAVSGVRPGTSQTIVTATSTTWTVTPFGGVIDGEAAAEAGPYGFAFDANKTGSINAAHATYPRWDTLAVQINDPAESDGSSVPSPAIVYTAGVASASPAEPALPARSFLLARIVVPQSGGGSPSVVWLAPVMAAAGGFYLNPPAAQQTALDAIATAASPVWIDDSGVLKRSIGAGFAGTGVLGRGKRTTNLGSITTTAVDLGMGVTATIPAGRLIRVSWSASARSGGAADALSWTLKDGAATVRSWIKRANAIDAADTPNSEEGFGLFESPSSGSHTWSLWLSRAVGSGNVTLDVTFGAAWLMVEDMGAA